MASGSTRNLRTLDPHIKPLDSIKEVQALLRAAPKLMGDEFSAPCGIRRHRKQIATVRRMHEGGTVRNRTLLTSARPRSVARLEPGLAREFGGGVTQP